MNTDNAASDDARRRLRERIEVRLRGVCPDWTEERFTRLVDEVVRIVLKYDHGRDAVGRPLPESERPSDW